MVLSDVSPCIGVCRLDEGGMCLGCYRYMDEIRAWGLLTADERRKILTEIASRRQKLPPSSFSDG